MRGWNWGKADVHGQDLAFSIGGKPAFTVPVGQVHNATINKSEVILEMNHPEMPAGVKKKALPDELVEMRVFIPGSESHARKKAKKADRMAERKEQKSKVKDEDGQQQQQSSESEPDTDDVSSDEGEEGVDGELSAAQVFHDTIKDRADIGKIQGESIMSFNEIHLTVPRSAFSWLLLHTLVTD